MKILIILASPNTPSNSSLLAEHFAKGFTEASTNTIRLSDLHLEHFTLAHYEEHFAHEADFITLQQAMTQADGIVIATPIWNFGVPAQLKNMIDRIGSFAYDRTTSKGLLNNTPVYLIFTGGAPTPAWLGSMKKTTSFVAEGLRYFAALPVGTYFEPKCTPGRGSFGLVVNTRSESLAKIQAEGTKFEEIVRNYVQTGSVPKKDLWHSKLLQVGEKLLKKFT